MWSIYFLLILMISIWGFSFIVVDISVAFTSSLSIALYRFLIASVGYILINLYQKLKKRKAEENYKLDVKKAYSKRDWIYLFISSLFGVSLFFVVQYSSINLIGPSIPALFVCLLAPVIITALALIFFKEKLDKLKIIGFVIATLGGFLLITGGNIENLTPASPNFIGYILALMTPIFWAIYSIISKKIVNNISANQMNKYICYLGTVELFFITLIMNGLESFIQSFLNPIIFLSSLYLGIGCYIFGYYIYQYSQSKIKLAKVASFLYIEPFFTLLFSILFQRSDIVVIWNILGGFIVLFAVILINYERK